MPAEELLMPTIISNVGSLLYVIIEHEKASLPAFFNE